MRSNEKVPITVYIDPTIRSQLETYRQDQGFRSLSAAAEVAIGEFLNAKAGEYITRAEIEPLLQKLNSWLK